MPDDRVARAAAWDQLADHEPTVLRLVAAVEELDFASVRSDRHPCRWVLRRENDPMSALERHRLGGAIGAQAHWTVRMAGEDAKGIIHHVGLAEIGGGQKLEVQSGFAGERVGKGAVEVYCDTEAVVLRGHLEPVVESQIGISRQADQLVGRRAAPARGERRYRVP